MSTAAATEWFVYILRCANGALYTGIATDVARRVDCHNEGRGSRYVRAHRPAILVAFTRAGNKSQASKMEWQVKQLPRQSKVRLASDWRRSECREGS